MADHLARVIQYEKAAIAEIEKALIVEGVDLPKGRTVRVESPAEGTKTMDRIKREGGKVWIQGLETVQWGRGLGNLNSVMACLSHSLGVLGEDMSYDYLMGVSGAAFRLQVAQPGWCPSAPHAACGFNCIDPAMAALNYELVEIGAKEDDADGVKKTRQAVVESINKGWPVLFGSEECGIIVGYQDGGKDLLVRGYGAKTDGYSVMDKWPWGVQLISRKEKAPPRRESILRSLQLAVEVANTQGYFSGDDKAFYASGFSAYETWIACLLDEQRNKNREKDFFSEALGNAWTYDNLADARLAASNYLSSIAGEFKPPTAEHLKAAAGLYEKLHEAIATERHGLRSSSMLYPWALKEPKHWTKQMRHAQAAALTEAMALERQAVAEIEKALAVEGVNASVGATLPKSAMLKDVPGGKAEWNAFAGGVTVMLNYTGTQADYDTVMGDLGQAFIMQASDQVPRYDGALDVGWWPLALDCLPVLIRLAGPSLGVALEWSGGSYEEYKADPAKYYRDKLQEAVTSSIASGRPALENHGFWEVVVGYDGKEPPVLSFCPSGKQKIKRLEKYPFAVVTLGDAIGQFERKQADIEALKRAVALSRDRIPMPLAYRTGQKAFALWAETLRDTKNLGQARYHANVVGNLAVNRQSAVTYLRTMAKRHAEKTATHLTAAADLYEQVLAELKNADTSEQALIKSTDGREKLAQLAERLAAIEAQAINEIEQALAAEGVAVPTATRAFSENDKKRLRQWRNIFGSNLEDCLDAAEKNPVVYELLTLELSLAPMSERARLIRDAMIRLEPYDLTYWALVEGLVQAIGGDTEIVKDDTFHRPAPGWGERQKEVATKIKVLELWQAAVPIGEAQTTEGTDPETVTQVYGLLGTPNAEKQHLADLVSTRLHRKGHSRADQVRLLKENERFEPFMHRIDALDFVHWDFDRSFALLLGDIGRGKVSGEWHKPGGPLAWGDGNPDDLPNVIDSVYALEAWLDGKPSGHEFAKTLGKPDSYKEKVWLARCLVVYLRDHRQNYYGWFQDASKQVVAGKRSDPD